MKIIKYKFLSAEINYGTEEKPNIEQIFLDKSMSWNEINEEIAKREAYNGEYEIFDDGEPEPEVLTDVTWDDLANALSEGVNSI